jgi:hypothetical protein
MRTPKQIQVVSASAALAFLVGCSGATVFAPNLAPPQGDTRLRQHTASYYSCPAGRTLEYVSENATNVIDIFVGKFAGQAPCGQLTSGVATPWGVFVDAKTHDLYVANEGASNILVFHRGQTSPYNTYSDPSIQYPVDVAVTNDGTVVASNDMGNSESTGSLSTWIKGPNGGTFVGNFPMTNSFRGRYVSARNDGTVYFDDIDLTTNDGALWSVSCPAGACGVQTKVAGLLHDSPGGLEFDSTGDLIVVESSTENHGTADTFELPNPSPSTFPMNGTTWAMALNRQDNHLFVSDVRHSEAVEYMYPSGVLVGFVKTTTPHSYPFGIAVDQ